MDSFEERELRLQIQSLTRQVADQAEAIRRLEQSVDSLRASRGADATKRPVAMAYRSTRRRSKATFMGLPLYDIATGPDPSKGEIRGHAKGIIAVGDIATGGLAIGGLAVGVVALGGGAVGLITLGGLSLGILFGLGGLATGVLAVGGMAIGLIAGGGGAAGYYAYGGGAVGQYVVSPVRRDAEAVEMLDRLPIELEQLLPQGIHGRR